MSGTGVIIAFALAGLVAFLAWAIMRRQAADSAGGPGLGESADVAPAWSLFEKKKKQTFPGVSAAENQRLRGAAYYKEQNALFQARRKADPRTRNAPYLGLDGWRRDAKGNILGHIVAPKDWEPA
jgi:hypothetical protein